MFFSINLLKDICKFLFVSISVLKTFTFLTFIKMEIIFFIYVKKSVTPAALYILTATYGNF